LPVIDTFALSNRDCSEFVPGGWGALSMETSSPNLSKS
jgi:hypothetical protein